MNEAIDCAIKDFPFINKEPSKTREEFDDLFMGFGVFDEALREEYAIQVMKECLRNGNESGRNLLIDTIKTHIKLSTDK